MYREKNVKIPLRKIHTHKHARARQPEPMERSLIIVKMSLLSGLLY